MTLPKDWPTRDPSRVPDDEERATEYQASRGGWYPKGEKPVPGTPRKG